METYHTGINPQKMTGSVGIYNTNHPKMASVWDVRVLEVYEKVDKTKMNTKFLWKALEGFGENVQPSIPYLHLFFYGRD